ncbi:hypothetical protein CLU79DRAFT_772584 [Phycomyces nitens]|nr:hypothetical protein CLU79DRAFT_772584 [Phycomyces nitens]
MPASTSLLQCLFVIVPLLDSIHCNSLVPNVIAAEDLQTPQYGHLVVSALLSAASVAYHFFRILFSSIYRLTLALLWPVYWLARLCWTGLVVKPVLLFAHICYVLWPITLFCLVAVCCGLLIGGCAGFAAEAFSSVLISATWGTEKQKPKETIVYDSDDDDKVPEPPGSDHTGYTGDSARMPRGYPLAAMMDEDDDIQLKESSSSSFHWDTSFFGGNRKGKERRGLPDATVESWRTSLSRRSSSSSVLSQTPQSATTGLPPLDTKLKKTTCDKQDDWEWGDDDEDDFPSRRNSR